MKPRISIYLFVFCISLILQNANAAEIKKPVLKARQDEKEARVLNKSADMIYDGLEQNVASLHVHFCKFKFIF